MFIGLFADAKVLFLFEMTKFFAYFFVFFLSLSIFPAVPSVLLGTFRRIR